MLTNECRGEIDVVVIGDGQAGLSAAYHLRHASRRAGRPRPDGVVVLDSNSCAGGAWQHRWRIQLVGYGLRPARSGRIEPAGPPPATSSAC